MRYIHTYMYYVPPREILVAESFVRYLSDISDYAYPTIHSERYRAGESYLLCVSQGKTFPRTRPRFLSENSTGFCIANLIADNGIARARAAIVVRDARCASVPGCICKWHALRLIFGVCGETGCAGMEYSLQVPVNEREREGGRER